MFNNKKAQELSIWGLLLGLVGLVIAVWITKLMEVPVFWKLLSIIACSILGYVIGAMNSS